VPALTTTTIAAIRANVAAQIVAVAPSFKPSSRFRLAVGRAPVRAIGPKGSGLFRLFDVAMVGGTVEPGVCDPSARLVEEELLVTVAYPVLGSFYGKNVFDDMEDTILADADLIRDRLFSSAHYLAGQLACFPTIRVIDKSDGETWFLEIALTVQFYKAQLLS
jgi:hypothetical protein